jgi:hypothetical protein
VLVRLFLIDSSMTPQVPGRAWAAEGILRLASQQAAARMREFGSAEAAAAAAAQHPSSMRAQVPQRTSLIYVMMSYIDLYDVCWQYTNYSCCLPVCLVCQALLECISSVQMQPAMLHVDVLQWVAVGACSTLQKVKQLQHQNPASELCSRTL